MLKLTTSEFIEKAKSVHGDRYDYSPTEYLGAKQKLHIACRIHGAFLQRPDSHLRGNGCPLCADNPRNEEEFKRVAKIKHGDKYDYSKVRYVDSKTEVEIICPTHGAFMQRPDNHIQGKGCMLCYRDKRKAPIYGIGINDKSVGFDKRAKKLWEAMLQRCYSPKSHEKNPNYKGCSVCKEWHTYSKFETWFLSQPNHARVGYELDKDLLANSKTNKIYSPQTCCLLPKELNAMIVFSSRDYADLPSGVYKPDKGKYFISYGGKASFSDKEEAHKEYLRRRKQAINTTANRLFEGGLIEERVYSALLNYKIKK